MQSASCTSTACLLCVQASRLANSMRAGTLPEPCSSSMQPEAAACSTSAHAYSPLYVARRHAITHARAHASAHLRSIHAKSVGTLQQQFHAPHLCTAATAAGWALGVSQHAAVRRWQRSMAGGVAEQLQLLGICSRVPVQMHAAWQLQHTAVRMTATQPKQVRNSLRHDYWVMHGPLVLSTCAGNACNMPGLNLAFWQQLHQHVLSCLCS